MSESRMKCWSCEAPSGVDDMLCGECGIPQPFHTVNAYVLFGLPLHFDVKIEDVESLYFERQRQIHPDRFASSDAQAKEYAAFWSTALNQVYSDLKDPLKRAQVLYQARGGEWDPEETSQDPEFLQEMMEFQELKMEDPAAAAIQIGQQQKDCLDQISQCFEVDLENVPFLMERYSYLQRLRG